MKLCRIINSEQSIASFMIGVDKTEMTYEEYIDWSDYLERALNVGNYQAIVFYGNDYLEQLKISDGGYLFDISDKSIKLAKGKTKEDLDAEVMAYMDVDTLLAVIDAIEAYQKEGEGLGK